MIDVLKGIYSDISIGSFIGFKGDTALYLFYKLPRFSVDLDFDLLDESKKETVFSRVSEISENIGELREGREKYFTLFWLISYEKGRRQLKIEMSKRNLGSSYEVKSYLGLPVLIMKKEDMFANKLTALLGRKVLVNRDIFDIWFMAKNNWDINSELLEKRTNMQPKKYLQKCIDRLEKDPPKSILNGLGDLLDNKTKDWVKKNLIKDTIFYLKLLSE
jgi:predicted nucleotidyltransferase component of viral defense system